MEDLAGMVAHGFAGMDTKFAEVDAKMEKEFDKVEGNFRKIRSDILEIGDKFVPRHEFDTLLIRVSRLEQRVKERVG